MSVAIYSVDEQQRLLMDGLLYHLPILALISILPLELFTKDRLAQAMINTSLKYFHAFRCFAKCIAQMVPCVSVCTQCGKPN